MARSFNFMETFLRSVLRLGFTDFEAGSLRWEGDHFIANPAVRRGERLSVQILMPDGKEAPQSTKEALLRDLEAYPSGKNLKWMSKGPTYEVVLDPQNAHLQDAASSIPGSAESEILRKLEASRTREIKGTILRGERGQATGVLQEGEPERRLQFSYSASRPLTQPFPDDVRVYCGALVAEIRIYSISTAEQPLPDSAFNPWTRLRRDSFALGVRKPNGRILIPDANDRALVNARGNF